MKPNRKPVIVATAADSVMKVGDGRGFIIEAGHRRLVITAAHCLPHLPPPHGASYNEERTYADLLGSLGAKPEIWAECIYVDPVADIAVLGSVDSQAMYNEGNAYDALVDHRPVLTIADVPDSAPAWILRLNCEWVRCNVRHIGRPMSANPLWIEDAAAPIQAGMSGSPIIDGNGAAIGIVCTVCLPGGPEGKSTSGGGDPNPRLQAQLPGWLVSASNA